MVGVEVWPVIWEGREPKREREREKERGRKREREKERERKRERQKSGKLFTIVALSHCFSYPLLMSCFFFISYLFILFSFMIFFYFFYLLNNLRFGFFSFFFMLFLQFLLSKTLFHRLYNVLADSYFFSFKFSFSCNARKFFFMKRDV